MLAHSSNSLAAWARYVLLVASLAAAALALDSAAARAAEPKSGAPSRGPDQGAEPTLEELSEQIDELFERIDSMEAERDESEAKSRHRADQSRKRIEELQKKVAALDKQLREEQGRRQNSVRSFRTSLVSLTEKALGDFEAAYFDGIEFVKIPAGTFRMGISKGEINDLKSRGMWSDLYKCEAPSREVTISKPFLMAKFEVTQKQWVEVLNQGNPSAFKGPDLPLENIEWHGVRHFLRILSERTGAKYRLPTEAEWEYCARAGVQGVFGLAAGREQVTLENLGRYAWTSENSENRTHPVGGKAPNAWGLHDMHGNVWEWCLDTFACDSYKRTGAIDPFFSEPGTERVFRGGCWDLDYHYARCAFRAGNLAEYESQYVGFRVLREFNSLR